MFFTRLLIDQSGSMCGRTTEVVESVNKFIDQLSREPVDQQVSMAFFESTVDVVRPFQGLGTFQKLEDGDYNPTGDTALYDALGMSIDELEQKLGREGRAVIAVVTDGQENGSMHYTLAQVREMIAAKRQIGWVFLFLTLGSVDLPESLIKDLGLLREDVIRGDKAFLPAAMKQLTSKVRGYLHA